MAQYSLFILLISVLLVSPPKDNNKYQKPNVIVILADDLGYNDVGFNGSSDIKTPNIDRIAKNGVVFTNGYVTFPVCGPSRAGLITGRYQGRFGFSRNPLFAPKDSLQGLPLSEQTLAECLKATGYATKAIGKWHLGAHHSQRPLRRGFDEFFGFLSGGHQYFPDELIRNDISEVISQFDAYKTKLLNNNIRVEEKEYLTDAFSREAVNFIEKKSQESFFLYLAYNAPHTPLQATDKYLYRYTNISDKKRRTYAAMVSAVDDGVGRILDKLKELNIERNTLVFFLSDNGGPESKGANNGELREGKGSVHEGGIRVPFALQWPGVVPHQEYNYPVISLDIFATVAAQANAQPTNNLDGKNLIPYLTDSIKEAPHQELYWRNYDRDAYAIRQGNLKLVKNRSGQIGLFDLQEDIGETQPIKDSLKIKTMSVYHNIWNENNLEPVFDGLLQNASYNKKHPERFKNVEHY